jgi:copper homeostasis protein
MNLEACVENLSEALLAEKLGAYQIELCDRLDLDGTSPSIELVRIVSQKLNIPVKVIINPTSYNYIYSDRDIISILDYITQLNNSQIQGIVFGPMTIDNLPDLDALKIVSQHTSLPITFHKAIDSSRSILESTNLLMQQDLVKFILTSGGAPIAEKGIDKLLEMKNILKNSNIQPIAAGRITNKNLQLLHTKLDFSYYHGKRIVGKLNGETLD